MTTINLEFDIYWSGLIQIERTVLVQDVRVYAPLYTTLV